MWVSRRARLNDTALVLMAKLIDTVRYAITFTFFQPITDIFPIRKYDFYGF